MDSAFTLHAFAPAHLPELTDLWVASWRTAMPQIDFEARRPWFIGHLNTLRARGAEIVCAIDARGSMAGFVTIDCASGELDQLAVAPRCWGSTVALLLLDEAKRRSPGQLLLEVNQDNPRAVRFYEKHGLARAGESVNAHSGLKTWRYAWRAGAGVPVDPTQSEA